MTATTVINTTLLKLGDRSPEVTDLQYLLLARGGASQSSLGAVDGDFGPKTRAAVMHYQRSRGLEADGIVGQATWGEIAPVTEWPAQRVGQFMRQGDTGAEALQQGLKTKGYYDGAVDGDFGPRTHTAVVKMQRLGISTNTAGVVGPFSFIFAAINPAVSLGLWKDGIRAIKATGSISNLAFGLEVDIVRRAVSATLAAQPTSIAKSNECPAGPLTTTRWPNGFAIVSNEQAEFVGWNVQPHTDSARLTTLQGVGIGTTLAKLREAFDISVFESSLGTEFSTGKLSGLLTSNQPDAAIKNLWAGTNCIFR